MKLFYCSKCWIHLRTEADDSHNQIVDKTTEKCEKCFKEDNPPVHHNTLRTHCKRGHLLVDYRTIKDKISRVCKICQRLAEQKHRDNHPGYHSKYHKKEKDAT